VCVIRVLRDKLNEENFWASFGAWCLRPNYIFGFVSERKTDRDWVPKKQNRPRLGTKKAKLTAIGYTLPPILPRKNSKLNTSFE